MVIAFKFYFGGLVAEKEEGMIMLEIGTKLKGNNQVQGTNSTEGNRLKISSIIVIFSRRPPQILPG